MTWFKTNHFHVLSTYYVHWHTYTYHLFNHGRIPARKAIAPRTQRWDSDPFPLDPKAHSLPIPHVACPVEFSLGPEYRMRWENRGSDRDESWHHILKSLDSLVAVSNLVSPVPILLSNIPVPLMGLCSSKWDYYVQERSVPKEPVLIQDSFPWLTVPLSLYFSLFIFLSLYTLGEKRCHEKEFREQAILQLTLFRRRCWGSGDIPGLAKMRCMWVGYWAGPVGVSSSLRQPSCSPAPPEAQGIYRRSHAYAFEAIRNNSMLMCSVMTEREFGDGRKVRSSWMVTGREGSQSSRERPCVLKAVPSWSPNAGCPWLTGPAWGTAWRWALPWCEHIPWKLIHW